MDSAKKSKHAIIVGGSLSGLMHGIMLHRSGWSVLILEQSNTDTPVSHMAGVCLGPDVLQFLERFDRVSDSPLGIPATQLQSLDQHGQVRPFLQICRIMSSWDALYFRLRANYDMLNSVFVSKPPVIEPLPGENIDTAILRAKYEVGKQVSSIEEMATGKLLVKYKSINDGGKEEEAIADMVLGADGPNSIIRKIFLQELAPRREYSGYVAWRGVVAESEVSEKTRDMFQANITYSIMQDGSGHVIVYNIPGEDGSIKPGKRILNFCWYTNITSSLLDEIMTDTEGIRHHTKLSPGKVRPHVWEERRAYAHAKFALPYVEIVDKIVSPFVHLITDYHSPRASFANGKILLVGDASTLLRPHIAFSTNQAAYQALLTEKLVKGDMSPAQYEYQVTKATYLHWRRSVWFGEYFQQPLYVALMSATRYWVAMGMAKIRVLLGWIPKQAV